MDNDLPPGYRWATEDEMDRPDAIVVKRTADHAGVPYTQDEADIAVPIVDEDLRLVRTPDLVREFAAIKVADALGGAILPDRGNRAERHARLGVVVTELRRRGVLD